MVDGLGLRTKDALWLACFRFFLPFFFFKYELMTFDDGRGVGRERG
jgi:hypothetical protein